MDKQRGLRADCGVRSHQSGHWTLRETTMRIPTEPRMQSQQNPNRISDNRLSPPRSAAHTKPALPCGGTTVGLAYYKARGLTFNPHAPRCWCCSGMYSPDVTSSASLHSCVRPVLLGVEGEATVAASRNASARSRSAATRCGGVSGGGLPRPADVGADAATRCWHCGASRRSASRACAADVGAVAAGACAQILKLKACIPNSIF